MEPWTDHGPEYGQRESGPGQVQNGLRVEDILHRPKQGQDEHAEQVQQQEAGEERRKHQQQVKRVADCLLGILGIFPSHGGAHVIALRPISPNA